MIKFDMGMVYIIMNCIGCLCREMFPNLVLSAVKGNDLFHLRGSDVSSAWVRRFRCSPTKTDVHCLGFHSAILPGFLLLVICIGLIGCATPSAKFSATAENMGFYPSVIKTHLFDHKIYRNAAALKPLKQDVLHIYIDGDGTPWQDNRWIANDPTSRNHLILELMNQDSYSSILLGRPCYHGFNTSDGCHYRFWTSDRYSKRVVKSMTSALKIWLREHQFSRVVLIGFSGGGTLAVLIAPHLRNLDAVVTIAANLDVAAWSAYHGYQPLPGSMDPALQPRLRRNIRQIHMTGKEDTVVPPTTIKAYLDKEENSRPLIFNNFNHHCCWVDLWPTMISNFHTENKRVNLGIAD